MCLFLVHCSAVNSFMNGIFSPLLTYTLPCGIFWLHYRKEENRKRISYPHMRCGLGAFNQVESGGGGVRSKGVEVHPGGSQKALVVRVVRQVRGGCKYISWNKAIGRLVLQQCCVIVCGCYRTTSEEAHGWHPSHLPS